VACSRRLRRCAPAAELHARTLPAGCDQYRADYPLLARNRVAATEGPRLEGISALVPWDMTVNPNRRPR
jgi:hypothetical protein